jgi:hypothetical protein
MILRPMERRGLKLGSMSFFLSINKLLSCRVFGLWVFDRIFKLILALRSFKRALTEKSIGKDLGGLNPGLLGYEFQMSAL